MRGKHNGPHSVGLTVLVAAVAAFTGCAQQGDSVKHEGTRFTVLVSKALKTGETDHVRRLLPSEGYLELRFWEASMHKSGRELLEWLGEHVREKLAAARKEAADSGFDWNAAKLTSVRALSQVPFDKRDEEAETLRMAYASILGENPISNRIPISDLLPLMEGFSPDYAGTAILCFQFQDSDFDVFVVIHTIQAEGRRVVEPMFAFITMYEMTGRREPGGNRGQEPGTGN